ncbi:hypothetical protein M405DRAFT_6425 [Rhizopogon salebrosus TDB-379]|nr:hypothetical protein M405DRAFT_6425 [Rhizopogon salebrosus TDB-379]
MLSVQASQLELRVMRLTRRSVCLWYLSMLCHFAYPYFFATLPRIPSPLLSASMANKYQLLDHSKFHNNAPPSYEATSTSGGVVQCGLPSVLSIRRIQETRTNVLSLIRDIVSTPDFIPSSVASIVNSCAASLSATDFSDLLQTPNIEGHTALYWAIVNNRREALITFIEFIPKFSLMCSSDLRLACMTTNDHALFVQLNLGTKNNSKDEPLRRSLGLPDEIQVHEGDGLDGNKFVASLRVRMCQRRVRITKEVGIEFIAKGRIWWLRFYPAIHGGGWNVALSLSRHSCPARLKGVLMIEAHRGKSGCTAPPKPLRGKLVLAESTSLAPYGYASGTEFKTCNYVAVSLGDWLLHDSNTIYADSDGTLHAKLEVTLI